tara:strand:+ start:442 stop:612 length:171 start_codon:yes stop_codon:yes gene_type:complete
VNHAPLPSAEEGPEVALPEEWAGLLGVALQVAVLPAAALPEAGASQLGSTTVQIPP